MPVNIAVLASAINQSLNGDYERRHGNSYGSSSSSSSQHIPSGYSHSSPPLTAEQIKKNADEAEAQFLKEKQYKENFLAAWQDFENKLPTLSYADILKKLQEEDLTENLQHYKNKHHYTHILNNILTRKDFSDKEKLSAVSRATMVLPWYSFSLNIDLMQKPLWLPLLRRYYNSNANNFSEADKQKLYRLFINENSDAELIAMLTLIIKSLCDSEKNYGIYWALSVWQGRDTTLIPDYKRWIELLTQPEQIITTYEKIHQLINKTVAETQIKTIGVVAQHLMVLKKIYKEIAKTHILTLLEKNPNLRSKATDQFFKPSFVSFLSLTTKANDLYKELTKKHDIHTKLDSTKNILNNKIHFWYNPDSISGQKMSACHNLFCSKGYDTEVEVAFRP